MAYAYLKLEPLIEKMNKVFDYMAPEKGSWIRLDLQQKSQKDWVAFRKFLMQQKRQKNLLEKDEEKIAFCEMMINLLKKSSTDDGYSYNIVVSKAKASRAGEARKKK